MPIGSQSTAEHRRLAERVSHGVPPWRRWGCYVGDRAWGTVREDYSADGDAWRFLTHDMSRAKAYRWGEDGIAGLCDRYQILVFAPAFWNGRDPILKERFFGLTSIEGNHGEDVKEYYFYLDNTPTHSYMRMLYKYPQAEFPYRRLIDENAKRRAAAWNSNCSTPASSTATGTSTSSSSTRRTGPKTSVGPDRGLQPRPGRGAAPRHPAAVVSQHLGVGTDHAAPSRSSRSRLRGRRARRWPCSPTIAAPTVRRTSRFEYQLGERRLYGSPERRAALHEQRDQLRTACYGPTSRSASPLHEGRISPLHRPRRRDGGESGADRHEGVPALFDGDSRRAARRSGASASRPIATRTRSTTSTRSSRSGRQKPTSSTRPSIRRTRARTSGMVQRQALAGMLWTKQIYLFDVHQWLERRRPGASAARRAGASSATRTGAT